MRRMSHMLSGQTQGADEWDDYHTAPCLFFYFFWISDQANQPCTVQERKEVGTSGKHMEDKNSASLRQGKVGR